MDRDPIAQFLEEHPFFRGLTPTELEEIVRLATLRRLDAGEMLGLEGDPCRSVYLVMEGAISVRRVSFQGREQVLNILEPGQPIYLIPALDGGALPATTQAVSKAMLAAFGSAEFVNVLQTHPSVAMNVLRELAQRLRKFSALIGDLSLLTVPQRLAKLLVERARSGGRHHATQREMAAQLGTVREVVARSLSQFEDQGWVRVGRGVIEILDADMLEEYALTGEGM